MLASPFTIITCKDETADIEAVISLISQHQVERVVVGLARSMARSMDGSLGKQAEKVKAFVQKLCRHTQVPVEFRDERLSTVLAQRLMKAADARKPRKKARDDAVAAAIILQGYLDEGRFLP